MVTREIAWVSMQFKRIALDFLTNLIKVNIIKFCSEMRQVHVTVTSIKKPSKPSFKPSIFVNVVYLTKTINSWTEN